MDASHKETRAFVKNEPYDDDVVLLPPPPPVVVWDATQPYQITEEEVKEFTSRLNNVGYHYST